MSNFTTLVPTSLLRRIAALTAASASNASIAETLIAEGWTLPRDAAIDHRHAPASGFNLSNALDGDPSRWTASAVAAVKACSNYATGAASATNTVALQIV